MKRTSETSETLETYACNMPLKQLQHPLIYFYDIYMKQMQHTFETPETYICNIGEGKTGLVDSGRRGGGALLHRNFYKALLKWPPRQLGQLPASVIRGRAVGPVTVSVNA
jgi:hypothetical protein